MDNKENGTKRRQLCFRASEDIESMIESHMAANNCQSKNEFIEKAIRWYCAKLDGETNDGIITPELIKAMKAVQKEQTNRLAKLIFKEAVSLSMAVRYLATLAEDDDIDFDRLRAKAVKDVQAYNGSLDIRTAFYDEMETRNDE